MIRELPNYGGRTYRTSTFTGESVERAAAPVEFRLNNENCKVTFRVWEDVTDFEDDKKPFDAPRDFSAETEVLPVDLVDAIKNGALEFLELGADYEFASIFIDALSFTISVSAKHKTKDRYVNENVRGLGNVEVVKLQYLDSIVLPFIQMAWTFAAADRDLKKFE